MNAAREAFLDMMADANEWHIETDEGGTIHTIETGEQQLVALAKALGIDRRWGETIEDSICRAIDGGDGRTVPKHGSGP